MIYILIPIHNRKGLTLACLASLKKQEYHDYRIIVIDDGSTDGSEESIKKTYPEITIIRGDGDWWWTKSINNGVCFALSHSKPGDFILTLNDDTEVEQNYLQALIDTSTSYQRAIVGSLVKNYYDPNVIQDAGVQTNWSKFLFSKRHSIGNETVNESVGALSGRGMLIPVEIFSNIGLFSRMLPHYSADYEFSARAKHHGAKIVMSYRAIVYSKDRLDPNGKEQEQPFWKKYFSRRSSSNIPMQIALASIGAPRIYLKIKCIGIILARFIRDLSFYAFRKVIIF